MKNRLISLMSIVVLASLTIEPLICFSNAIDVQTEHQRQEQEQKQQQFDDIPVTPNKKNNDIVDSNEFDKVIKNKYQTGTTRRRSAVNDNTCTAENVCNDNESFSIMLAPTTPPPAPAPSSPSSVDIEYNENDGLISNLMNRLTRFFSNNNNLFSRLMNGLFNVFQQNNDNNEDSKYMFPTNTIVTSLSKYSNKLKNLTKLINDEMETLSSSSSSTNPTSSNATNMIYSVSVANMNALNSVLDSMLIEFNRQETMNIQTISCYLLQFVTYIHNTTVPNIESMTQILYTKTNNDNMNNMWKRYSSSTSSSSTIATMGGKNSSTSSTTLRTTINKNTNRQDQCTDVTKSVARQDLTIIGQFLDFIFSNSIDVGPFGHIIRIVALTLFFPISFIVSLLTTLVFITNILVLYIRDEPDTTDDPTNGPSFTLVLYLFFIGLPIVVIYFIFQNILLFFQDILDLTTTYQFKNLPNTSSIPTNNKSSPSPLLEAASDVKNQLSLVLLDSPLQSILNVLKDSTTYTDQYIDDDELIVTT